MYGLETCDDEKLGSKWDFDIDFAVYVDGRCQGLYVGRKLEELCRTLPSVSSDRSSMRGADADSVSSSSPGGADGVATTLQSSNGTVLTS